MHISLPDRERVEADTPLRLSVAAELAFPDGSMTPSGLRREGARGRLVIERIAGKDYTTLANIERMRELCRVAAKVPDLWLRPARRKGGRIVGNAVWIIIDGNQHVATGCLEDQAREAEKRLAAYIADKYRPSRLAKDIDQIDVADVLSIYLDDCGPRIADQPKLERTIGRLNDYWGGKIAIPGHRRRVSRLRQERAARPVALERTSKRLRAAINHHAKEGLHYGMVRVTLPPKGLPRDRWLTRERGRQADLGVLAVPRASDRPSRPPKGQSDCNREAAAPAPGSVHSDRPVYRHAGERDRGRLAVPGHAVIRSSTSTRASTTGSPSVGARPTSGKRRRRYRRGSSLTCGAGFGGAS